MRPKGHKFLNRNKNQNFTINRNNDFDSQIDFLTNQMNQLIELMTRITQNKFPLSKSGLRIVISMIIEML